MFIASLLLTSYFLLPAPAFAQQTCASDQQYCASGAYAGQCRPESTTCPTGSVAATVNGCTACQCPAGQVLCSNACTASKAGQACTTSSGDAGVWDACGTICIAFPPEPVILTPRSAQSKTSTLPVISVNQAGEGSIANFQKNYKSIVTVNQTGLQVGYDPDPAKFGLDLGAASGGQNVFYGVARSLGLHPEDFLLRLQTVNADGSVRDRFNVDREGTVRIGNPETDLSGAGGLGFTTLIAGKAKRSTMGPLARLLELLTFNDDGTGNNAFVVDGDGNATASGSVTGSALCLKTSGPSDCRTSWETVSPDGVQIQAVTPGSLQSGNFNVSGTGRVGSLVVGGGMELGDGRLVEINAHGYASGSGNDPFYVNSDGPLQLRVDVNDATDGVSEDALFSVNNGGNGAALTLTELGRLTLFGDARVNAKRFEYGAGGLLLDPSAGVALAPTVAFSGIQVRSFASSAAYANLWHDGTRVILGDSTTDPAVGLSLDGGNLSASGGLTIAGGVTAGSGRVGIIDANGKIPDLSSTYIANMSGSALTGLNASEIQSGTVPDARLPVGLVRTTQATTFTAAPTGSDVLNGGLVVAPASAAANATLFGVATGTAEKFRVDAEGDAAIAGALDVASGIQAGSGNVSIVDASGKIPALSATYIANLSGAGLTDLNASNLTSGSVPGARLPSNLLTNPIDGGGSAGPWLTIQGGGSMLENTALRLYDLGGSDANVNALEFAHFNGTGVRGVARVKSVNVGSNAASGAKLKIETASDNVGTWNSDQLVLNENGTVQTARSLTAGSDVIVGSGDLRSGAAEYLNLWANNSGAPLYGAGKARVGGLVVGNDYTLTVGASDLRVKGNTQVDGTRFTVGGSPALVGFHRVTRACANLSSCSAACTAGEVALGGGCDTNDATAALWKSVGYTTGDGWLCRSSKVVTSLTAEVYCAKQTQ